MVLDGNCMMVHFTRTATLLAYALTNLDFKVRAILNAVSDLVNDPHTPPRTKSSWIL